MAGLYIHIPFCKQACTYCDFHFSTSLKNKSEMVNVICREIELRKNYLAENKLNSIYFGGGTPSLLDKKELEEIFEAIGNNFTWDKDTEITLECNPDDLSSQKLDDLKSVGINRLSVGLQSFNDDELKWMNRAHDAAQSESSIKLAQDKGFDNITIDLMYGSKFQDLKSWEQTLKKAIALNVQHISSYNLTVENKTALGVAVSKGLEPLIDEEKSSAAFLLMTELLEQNGFIHYEISNFGKEGFFAVHNSNYWKGSHYLGIGPSAHSYNGIERQWNIANNSIYINALKHNLPYFEIENLSPENKYNEYVLTGLRTIWGCDLDFIKENFGEKFAEHFLSKLKLQKPEFYTQKENNYSLTKKGKLFADRIASELFI
jgi:oxygen-independent coproporphyrinogen-3 oxidase